MDQKYTLSSIRQDMIDNNLHVKAIIQDILAFRGSLNELEALNEAGRSKLSALRKCIEKLDDWAKDDGDPELSKEVDSHREQFSKTLQTFRRANIAAVLEIEKANKDELLSMSNKTSEHDDKTSSVGEAIASTTTSSSSTSSPPGLRKRGGTGNIRFNRTSLISQQDNITDKMLSISRHLSETTQKSAATLETLVSSSYSVESTRDELQNTAGTISQSGKLLKKYGRRECTDKILLFFAFIFFLACVFYIVQKRLF